MGLLLTQYSVGTSVSSLVAVPPGPCQVVFTVPGPGTVAVGLGTSVSLSSGFPVTSSTSPVPVAGFAGSGGTPLYAVASGSAVALGVAVSEPR